MCKLKITIFVFLVGFVFSSCSRHISQSIEATSLYYVCPMHSEVFASKPGHCPKCLMELVQWDPKSSQHNNSNSSHSGHSSSSGGGCH